MAKTAVKVWGNRSKFFHLGRPATLRDEEVPQSVCPAISPGGRGMHMGPGDVVYDDMGIVTLVRNDASAFMAWGRGEKSALMDDIKSLGVPMELLAPVFKDIGNGLAECVFKGAGFLLHDVTPAFQAAIDRSENRLLAAKTIADLEAALAKANALVAQLTAEAAELKAAAASKMSVKVK